jgi:hypothetical protein
MAFPGGQPRAQIPDRRIITLPPEKRTPDGRASYRVFGRVFIVV